MRLSRSGDARRRAPVRRPAPPRRRAGSPASGRRPTPSAPAVSRDWSRPPTRRTLPLGWALPVLAGLFSAALLLSALRTQVRTLRLELTRAEREQEELRRTLGEVEVRARRLRHPARLRARAADLGLEPAPVLLLQARPQLPADGGDGRP